MSVGRKSSEKGPKRFRKIRSLKINEWPSADERAWKSAIQPGIRLCRGGSASHLAKVSQSDIANRYGLYLNFLQRRGLLNLEQGAGELVRSDVVETYLCELKQRVSSVTVWNSIYKLRRAAQFLAPVIDF